MKGYLDIIRVISDLNNKVRLTPIFDIGVAATAALHQRCKDLQFKPLDFHLHENLDEQASCHYDGNDTLYLNSSYLLTIWDAAMKDKIVPGLDMQEQLRVSISLFALHEANHLVQNLFSYLDVAKIKNTAGRGQFLRLDIKSDIAASLTLASLDHNKEQIGGVSRSYIVYLTAAMFMTIRVFDLPYNNRFKLGRLVSLYASRQAFIDSLSSPTVLYPSLYCSFSEDFTSISVFDISDSEIERYRGGKTLLKESHREISDALESNDLEELFRLLALLGILA